MLSDDDEGPSVWGQISVGGKREAERDKVQMPLSHICNRLSFTSDHYRALVLSSLCVLQLSGPTSRHAPAKCMPPIKGPSSDKQDKQVQFLAGLIKGLNVNPMANFK